MAMKKRFLLTAMTLLIALSITACGKKQEETAEPETEVSTEAVQPETEAAEEETEEAEPETEEAAEPAAETTETKTDAEIEAENETYLANGEYDKVVITTPEYKEKLEEKYAMKLYYQPSTEKDVQYEYWLEDGTLLYNDGENGFKDDAGNRYTVYDYRASENAASAKNPYMYVLPADLETVLMSYNYVNGS